MELYPRLYEPIQKDNQVLIEGTVDIIDRNKTNWATYEIRIVFPDNYPLRIPTLFEIGGQIERSPEWHVNHDGSCCLAPPAKIYLELVDGITLKKWLEKLVIPFMANHEFKLKTGQYSDVEYSHGGKGIREFYRKWFGMDDDKLILRKVKYITGEIAFGRNDGCFCGSGKKYKNCHWNSKEYLEVPIEIIKEDIQYLK
ncbi:MAG: SEC-C domain-containing protein [Bacteroidota bacterium]